MQRKKLVRSEPIDAFPFPTTPAPEHPWHDAAEQAARAYRVWCQAALDERADAFAVYRAAEEREAAAAEELWRAGEP